MVWCYSGVNDTSIHLLTESWKCSEEPWWGERSLSRYVTNVFPPFLFMRYLFNHILAMKTVAMENTQRSRHCERSASQLRVFTKRLQFSRRQCKRTKEERDESVYCKRAQISINKEGPWGWLTKWQTKQLHCWAGMSACCHHDTTREAGRCSVCVVR